MKKITFLIFCIFSVHSNPVDCLKQPFWKYTADYCLGKCSYYDYAYKFFWHQHCNIKNTADNIAFECISRVDFLQKVLIYDSIKRHFSFNNYFNEIKYNNYINAISMQIRRIYTAWNAHHKIIEPKSEDDCNNANYMKSYKKNVEILNIKLHTELNKLKANPSNIECKFNNFAVGKEQFIFIPRHSHLIRPNSDLKDEHLYEFEHKESNLKEPYSSPDQPQFKESHRQLFHNNGRIFYLRAPAKTNYPSFNTARFTYMKMTLKKYQTKN